MIACMYRAAQVADKEVELASTSSCSGWTG